MRLVSKFRRDIDFHFGIKLVIVASLDKMQHVLEVKIHRNPVGRNGLSVKINAFLFYLHFVKPKFALCIAVFLLNLRFLAQLDRE